MERLRRRIPWVLAGFLLLWSLLGWRTWYWQSGVAPLVRAVHQHALTLPLQSRGWIRDRNGVPLTDPRPAWAVALFPAHFRAGAAGAGTAAEARLAGALGMPPARLSQLLRAAGESPTWLVRGLSAAEARRVADLGLPGVAVVEQPERYGPRALARHLVGYVNLSGGVQGLEAAFDAELRGEGGLHLAGYGTGRGAPFQGLGIRPVTVTLEKPPWDLYLTLDSRLQAAVEAALDAAAPEARAAAVVLDPHTGEVLALASRPQFDPRVGPPPGEGDGGELINRALAAYPPGSVFKALVAAAALEEGLVTPDTLFDCPGHYAIGDQIFREPVPGGHGRITLAEALHLSCNIFFIHLGYQVLGREGLLAAARRFGLGAPTGIGLPEEDKGVLPELRWDGEVAMFAFGQGAFGATPLQVARAYAALATDGRLPPVRLVDRLTTPAGKTVEQFPRRAGEAAVSPEVARTMQAILQGVTQPGGVGTGQKAWVPGWGSAGKTGSAEAAGDAVHAWFVGWVPLHQPRYVIAVLVEEGGAGGEAAAPIFRAIAEAILALPGPGVTRGY
ncbi:MAG: penicillin-binding transpeptidase domain-containing protein [Bacillota bacterium]